MNQAAEAEFTGVPGKESRVRQTHPEGPAMLLRLDGDSDLRQQAGAVLSGGRYGGQCRFRARL